MTLVLVASTGRDDAAGVIALDTATREQRVVADGNLGSLAVHPELPVIYGIEYGERQWLRTWRLSDGDMCELSRVPLDGRGACAAAVVSQRIVVAHFFSGHVTSFGQDEQGRPGESIRRALRGHGPEAGVQDEAHPHHVLDVGGIAAVADLGSDAVWMLEPRDLSVRNVHKLPQGAGPRHATLLPNGSIAVSGELDVTLVVVGADGTIASTESSRAGSGDRTYPSDVAYHPGGFVMVANRTAGTIGCVDVRDGELRLVGEYPSGGTWPLNMELVVDQLLVAQRDDDLVVALQVDPLSGRLEHEWSVPVERPMWVSAIPAGFLDRPIRQQRRN